MYATGRSSRTSGPSEIGRPETIEETGDLSPQPEVEAQPSSSTTRTPTPSPTLLERIDHEQGRLDILVNDIFGGDRYAQFDRPLWEHDLRGGLRMLRMGVETHLVTSAIAIPLMLRSGGGLVIEMTDGHARVQHDVPPRCRVLLRPREGGRRPDRPLPGRRSWPITRSPRWGSPRAGCGPSRCSSTSGSPRRTGGGRTRPRLRHLGVPHLRRAGHRGTDSRSRGRPARRHVRTARELADTYGVTDVDGSRPDCWRLIADHGIG